MGRMGWVNSRSKMGVSRFVFDGVLENFEASLFRVVQAVFVVQAWDDDPKSLPLSLCIYIYT